MKRTRSIFFVLVIALGVFSCQPKMTASFGPSRSHGSYHKHAQRNTQQNDKNALVALSDSILSEGGSDAFINKHLGEEHSSELQNKVQDIIDKHSKEPKESTECSFGVSTFEPSPAVRCGSPAN